MKIVLITSLLLSSQLYAGDLIFKQGFENDATLKGNATGISSTGLILKLTSAGITELLAVDENGEFNFKNSITIGANWNVAISAFPSNPQPLTCTLSNSSGTMTAAGVDNLQVTCGDAALNWNQGNWDSGVWN